MSEQSSKPPVMFAQYPLPFDRLDYRRFEDLSLRIAMQKCGVKNMEHVGRAGGDQGVDIQGYIECCGENIPVAIQCKRYEKMAGSDLVQALQEFRENFPAFIGQFWIITSANPSKDARNKLEVAAKEKNLEIFLIDGSVLEAHIRSLPDLVDEFFLTPSTPFALSRHDAAVKIIKSIQKLKDEFLLELDKSFSGNCQLVFGRQRIMGQILTTAVIELRSEMAVFLDEMTAVVDVENAGRAVINNYRNAAQTTSDGLPFFGGEVSSNALLEDLPKRTEFQNTCDKLSQKMESYLF